MEPLVRTTGRARVRGTLDTLSVGTRSFVLRLDDGAILPGGFGGLPIDELRALLGERVVVEGIVRFRLTGAAERVEAECVQLAAVGDAVWARAPSAAADPQPHPTPAGLDALFGRWPGDETDEQLAAALRADG